MAGAAKTITFASRQMAIAGCGIINLKFAEGDLRSEYISGSEVHNDDGSWSYTFLVQEEDLPGSLLLADVKSCNIVEPYWTCFSDDEEAIEDEECEIRNVSCFSAPELIETLTVDDFVPVLRHNLECDTYCLGMMNAYDFSVQSQTPIIE